MYEQVAANKRRSALLVVAFVAAAVGLAVLIAWLFSFGTGGVVVAVALALALSWGSYWKSDSIALAVSRARPADPTEHARYHNLVEGLCIASGLPKPRLYIVDDPAPNAFATGRNPKHAAVAVTTGLLGKMNRVELEGVLAHELSHIKNYDILVNTIAVTTVGFLTILTDVMLRSFWFGGMRQRDSNAGPAGILAIFGLVLMILAPLLGRAMQAAVGRRRESLADLSAVEMTRFPPGLISALEKLRDDTTVVGTHSRATAHLWIEEPLPMNKAQGSFSGVNKLFATHPPIEERIAALREL